MSPKVAAAAAAAFLLSLIVAAPRSASAAATAQARGERSKKSPWRFLRALQPNRVTNGVTNGPPPPSEEDVLAESWIECDVYLTLGSSSSSSSSRHLNFETEDDGLEMLHCFLDDDDDDADAPRIVEIQGLDESEYQRVKDEVTADGEGSHHRFAFPGAVKKKGGGGNVGSLMGAGHGNHKGRPNVLAVPGRGKGHKYQAIDVDKLNDYESDARKLKGSRPRRSLVIRKTGVSTVLLLRVEAPDASTTCSHQDCAARTFGGYDAAGNFDGMNMVTQVNDCSYGKLQFAPPAHDPAHPDLINGTATVTIAQNTSGVHHGTVLDYALAAAVPIVGSLDKYDHIMAFMPPGVSMGGAAAWGSVGGKYSWYHDGYSLATGIQLHELGHNLGLGHSHGEDTGYMGYGGWDTKKCYNAPKSHWLTWYEEFHQVFDPLETHSKLVELVGLADYGEAMDYGDAETQAVVLRIEMYETNSLYLTYNRKEKMNIDVPDFQNKVTVTSSDGSGSSGLRAGLSPGQKFHAPVVAGSGMMLEIIACDRAEGTPDTFAVSIHLMGVGEPMCVPAQPIPSWGTAYAGALSDMLVGYYAFDDDLLDSSGGTHHGLVGGGSSSFTDGVVGRALSLDGVDDFISLPNASDFNFGVSDFTLTFWYRVSGDQSGDPAIITNKDWTSAENVGWLVSSNYGPGSNGDDISINFSDGIARADASQAMDVDFYAWHFVVVRIKRGEMMSLLRSSGADYGLQEDSIDFVPGSVDTGLPILIGASHGASAKTKMDIDDLGIWRRALSSEEVDAVFMAGLSNGTPLIQAMDPVAPPVDPMPTTLVANYELEHDLRDTSGNDLDATLEDGGGASYGTSDLGAHLTLNNVDVPAGTFLTLPDSGLLDFGDSTDFSISFWHRTTVDFSTKWPSDVSIITNKNFASGSYPGYTIGVGYNGKLEFNSADGSNRCDYDGSAGTMNDGQWHHVAFTQTQGASGQVTLYLDGRKVAQKSCTLNSHSSGNAIRVGASWEYPSLYTGDVDKIMIHRSALSHANVFALYVGGRELTMTSSPTSSMSPTLNPTLNPTRAPSSPPTLQPTHSPSSCDGVYNDVRCCGSESQKHADYRGTISVTEAGVECQAWSSQSPHQHSRTPANYPNSGLDENYCRNPDGEPRAWCYTNSTSTRWDYCTIPNCGAITMEPTKKPITPPSFSPSTSSPTKSPETQAPTPNPTTLNPTLAPTQHPSTPPSHTPTSRPTNNPSDAPTQPPSPSPSKTPTTKPTSNPSTSPSQTPTARPTDNPSDAPTQPPSTSPSKSPTTKPTSNPTNTPSKSPTARPTNNPSAAPTQPPSMSPSKSPTIKPTGNPTKAPITPNPTGHPTQNPTTSAPTPTPTNAPATPAPTPNPTPEPECTGIDNTCCGSFWFGAKQADYRGTISKTVGGIECQSWSSQSPHPHSRTPANYPNAGLEQNFCRNPDGEARAWCYTASSSKRWDYCDVLSCPVCEAGDPSQCGCSEVKQADYRGTQSQTISGEECQDWSTQSPHGHDRTPQNYPNAGLNANYCRNPDGEPSTWCYTSNPNKRWEYCGVPVCEE